MWTLILFVIFLKKNQSDIFSLVVLQNGPFETSESFHKKSKRYSKKKNLRKWLPIHLKIEGEN